ncbi:MAG: glycosyltransferase family 117 protein, partial [Longimicrobiales bacterium]
WDTSEYIATATIMGIPHPPGNPLFVVLARAWDLLLSPLGLSTAVRINLFSAMMSALAHGFWFLLADRILSFYSTDRVFRLIGATAAVLISATAFTVWNQSNVNEKVYTVTLFTIALLSWLAFRWRDHLGEGKDDNLILLMVFILALSVGNHLMAFLAAPALVAFILAVEPRTLLNWRLYVAGVFAVLLGLSVHLYLPLRAGLDPVINEADPTCETVGQAIVSVATMGRAGCRDLSDALQRKQYDKPSMFKNPIAYAQGYDVPRDAELIGAQYANYAQYFDWQWARSVNGLRSFFGSFRILFTLLFTGLGIFGAWSHYKRDRTSWIYFALLIVTLSIGLTFYLNFKYGYSYPGMSRDVTEVRERDYFFIVSFSLWGVWAGIGLAALWLWLSERVGDGAEAARRAVLDRMPATARRPSWRTAPVLLLALVPLFANWSWANRNYDYAARDWAYNLLMSVEPYGVLFTNGDNDTFPLWYLQETEGIRRDVTVIVMSYLNTPWYARQLRDLTQPCPVGVSPSEDPTRIICQRPYDVAAGPDFYRQYVTRGDTSGVTAEAAAGGAPTRSILPLSDSQVADVTNTAPYRLP